MALWTRIIAFKMYLLLLVLEHDAIHGCLCGMWIQCQRLRHRYCRFYYLPHSVKPLNAPAAASSKAVKTTVCCQICHLLPLAGAGISLGADAHRTRNWCLRDINFQYFIHTIFFPQCALVSTSLARLLCGFLICAFCILQWIVSYDIVLAETCYLHIKHTYIIMSLRFASASKRRCKVITRHCSSVVAHSVSPWCACTSQSSLKLFHFMLLGLCSITVVSVSFLPWIVRCVIHELMILSMLVRSLASRNCIFSAFQEIYSHCQLCCLHVCGENEATHLYCRMVCFDVNDITIWSPVSSPKCNWYLLLIFFTEIRNTLRRQ